ncbi:response regulator transcription factor [Gracilibacillus timonensis]|uniref:response regulator transcription factor n=1 Tax=Gracilibacillus timonensis TaxID=1816696 RepID=UPI000824ADA3|nr:response regulator [Gracilibacillus timonensis]
MENWKALIADDEFIIRDGIRSFVDWPAYHIEVVAEAEDGEEALEQAITHQVDMALVDLNMPIMDGITAMKKIKQKLPDCLMVVISGYDEFRFAQEAIRLQVEDYLLKPVDPDQLAEILRIIQQKLEQRQASEQYIQQASSQVEKNQQQLKNRFFQDWLARNLSEKEIFSQLQFFQLPQTLPQSLLVMKWLEGEKKQYFTQNQRHKYMEQKVIEWLENRLRGYRFASFIENEWMTFFLWDKLPRSVVTQWEQEIVEELQQHLAASIMDIQDTNITTVYHEAKQKVDKQVQLLPLVKEALLYIRHYYQDPDLSLERVADSLHVSSVYLSKMIKQELGVSYVQVLTDMRLAVAKDLLRTTDYNIREIAEQVGYDSQHYFSTSFRKKNGVTPVQFKRKG